MIPEEIKKQIEEKFPVTIDWNTMDTSGITRFAARYGYSLATQELQSQSTRIKELEEGLTRVLVSIPKQDNDHDWWPDDLTESFDKAKQLLNQQP